MPPLHNMQMTENPSTKLGKVRALDYGALEREEGGCRSLEMGD